MTENIAPEISPPIDFMTSYVRPFSTDKGLERIRKELNLEADEDQLLTEVGLTSNLIQILEKNRRSSRFNTFVSRINDAKLQAFYKIEPQDLVLLLSSFSIQISDLALSIALDCPEKSISFRRDTLIKQLTEEEVNPRAILKAIQKSKSPSNDKKLKMSLITRFNRLPPWAKIGAETSIVLLLLVSLFWVVPEIRSRYETLVQRRINDYLIENSLTDSPAPQGSSKETPLELIQKNSDEVTERENTKSSSEEVSSKRQPKVNDGEMWRFSFTGSGSNDLENSIPNILKKYMPGETPKNTVVPGGIQFDIMVETKKLLDVKNELEALVQQALGKAGTTQGSGPRVNLSWYKKKNMSTRKIPSGHVQVIIWISTL